MKIRDIVIGRPLRDDRIKHQKLSRLWGLPIMSSDAISSVAYALPAMLAVIVPAVGVSGAGMVGWIAIPIIVLLLILVISYAQIIRRYPNGGGSYVVSKETFGKTVSLLAAACLIVDYIMTVAVSISSATDALKAAFPIFQPQPYPIIVALACLAFVTLVNLRGVSESSKFFGVPTYAFIVAIITLCAVGLVRLATGGIHPIAYTADQIADSYNSLKISGPKYGSMSLIGTAALIWVVLRTFSSGCSALTGVEAISNAVPAFKEPSQRNAKHVLYMLGTIIVFTFGATCILGSRLGIIPQSGLTPIYQIAQVVFGPSLAGQIMCYFVQITTALILLLAANTAFNGLPILMSVLSHDKFMPRQFGNRSAKLSFSNGILLIFVAAGVLIAAFRANTEALIPFYAVGVFISFTLSQSGMIKNWFRAKDKGWWRRAAINGFGALLSGVGTVVIIVTKFIEGAWALLLVIPALMLFMIWVNKSYTKVNDELNNFSYKYKQSTSTNENPCVVLVSNMNKATAKTFNYALSISHNVTPLHMSTSAEYTERLQKQWADLKIDVPLTVVPAHYRNIFTPLEEYILSREMELQKGQNLTVLMTKFVVQHWYERLLHNQTARALEKRLAKHKDVVTVMIPYIYGYNKETREEQVARIEAEKAEREEREREMEKEDRLESEK